MKRIIIGTAGHVDHGKTTLIRALTGTDTDRLKEEQERGMTIDLGFASLRLPDGTFAGIVDVPGHSRFVKNMLAGAGGVDVALLVVAADESVMPQTIEHLDILRLLDVREGVVALTKADLVDADWLDIVRQDVREHLADTFLAEAPLVPVDSLSGKGLPELLAALASAASRVAARRDDGPFRLAVDRVFTRPGFGPVVTGTLASGTLRLGDVVAVLPQGREARVRGLQSHGETVERAVAGSRVAVNLAGIDAADLERGTVLCPPGYMTPTYVMDASLRVLDTAPRPLVNRARVRLHMGTAEIIGRMITLGVAEIGPGGEGFVQFRGETPFACERGERFVVRTYSPMATVAGGIVLDPSPPARRRSDAVTLAGLEARRKGTPHELLRSVLLTHPFGLTAAQAASATKLDLGTVEKAADQLVSAGDAIRIAADRLIGKPHLDAATRKMHDLLRAYHEANPLRQGMPREELRGALGAKCDARAFNALLTYWEAEGHIATEQAVARLPSFQVVLNRRQQSLYDRVVSLYEEARFQAPTIEEVSRSIGAPPDAIRAMVRVALDRGTLVRINEEVLYHASTLAAAMELIRQEVAASGAITASRFRDLTGSSRKFAVPVLEFLDARGFTRRVGDQRILVEQA